MIRTGQGIDVHRYDESRELWLGGVRLSDTGGLAGHSDADVILHAVTDGLLGSVAAGDIGSFFPSDREEWRGASSRRFVEAALEEVEKRSGVVEMVDVTFVGNRPKIGPVRDRLRESIARIVGLDLDRVSLKATTTDGLGLTGRGEGACAIALVTVEVKG